MTEDEAFEELERQITYRLDSTRVRGQLTLNGNTSMSTDPVTYLASLCEIQGIKYRIEDEGRTLRLGVGTIVLPSNANSSVPIPSSLTVIAGAVRTAQTLHPKPFNP